MFPDFAFRGEIADPQFCAKAKSGQFMPGAQGFTILRPASKRACSIVVVRGIRIAQTGVRFSPGPPNMFSLKPQFFDIFGMLAFIYIVYFSARGLFGKKIPNWTLFVLLLIGLTGLIIDSWVVYISYLK